MDGWRWREKRDLDVGWGVSSTGIDVVVVRVGERGWGRGMFALEVGSAVST